MFIVYTWSYKAFNDTVVNLVTWYAILKLDGLFKLSLQVQPLETKHVYF